MKFDFCIGNPPYNDEFGGTGDNETYAPPVYNKFIDAAYTVANKVELIHPARFLFNAGSTPKEWNSKMLSDEHFKVLHYEQDSSKVFSNTDITGGIAITYHDDKKVYGAIKTFTSSPELNGIFKKVTSHKSFVSIQDRIFIQNRFNLDELYKKYPNAKKAIGSEGRDKRFEKNIFSKVSEAFSEERQNNDDVAVLGIINNKRNWRYIESSLVDKEHENLAFYKVVLPTSNGSGAIGETVPTVLIGDPLVEKPNEGYTRSFIGLGSFLEKAEADNALKYVKSKFMRTMLGVLKITQDNNRDTWKYVPVQDFTDKSDIDWSENTLGVDKQLYNKYGLSREEIAFIETNLKEME